MNKDSYRKYVKNLLISVLSLVAFFAVFNIVVDPFDIFKIVKVKKFNLLKPDKNRQQRVTKIVELKLDKSQLEAVFIGSSRVDGSINIQEYKKLTGKNAKNLAMNALTHSETVNLVESIVKIHPEIKTVYIGLDFFRFLKAYADDGRAVNIVSKPKLTINEVNPLILSFDTIIASVNTVLINIKSTGEQKKTVSEGAFIHRLNQYKGTYAGAKLDYDEFKKLKNLKDELKNLPMGGIKVVYYINPTHATDMYLISQLGYLKEFEEWKIELAKNFDYYDFDFVNSATGENIDNNTKYFHESSHSTEEMGNIILESVVNGCNLDYCASINSKNAEFYNLKNRKALTNWEKTQKVWAQKVREIVKG